MKTKIILSAIVAIAMGLISLRCTNTIGNGSDIGNAAVVGKLYAADGVTPAAGIRVHIRPKKSLADTSGAGLIKRLASLTAVDSVVTDNAGRFAFDSTLDTGTYVIEAVSGNNAVLIDSVKVKKRDSTDTLPPDTLKPAGALKGVIKLSEGGDTRKVFVLAFGIDRFARVEADGRFKFSQLAEAAYDLRLISSLDNYGVLDTINIPVKSQDTTNLDTLIVPYTGIPVPKNLKIIYDSLKQIAAIRWSNFDSTAISGYKLYRKKDDSLFILISKSIKKDTIYFDTNLIQDSKYIYRVSSVNINDQEGLLSSPDTCVAKSAFKASMTLSLDSIQPQTKPFRYAIGADGSLFITINEQYICKIDNNGKVIAKFGAGKFAQLFDIVLDGNDNVFAIDAVLDSSRIIKYAKSGTYLSEWKIRNRVAYSIGIDSNMNIYVQTADSQFAVHVEIYDTTSSFIRMVDIGSDEAESISPSGDIYTFNSSTNLYSIFQTDGIATTTFAVLFLGQPVFQLNALDLKGNLFFNTWMNGFAEPNGIFIFNNKHQILARWMPVSPMNQYFIVKNNNCYILSTEIPIKLLIYPLSF